MSGVKRGDGYDEFVNQITPELDPHEPRELPHGIRDYEPIQPRGTNWRELGRKIWAPFAAIGAFLAGQMGLGESLSPYPALVPREPLLIVGS